MIKKLGILLVVVLFSFSFAAENNNVLDAQDKAEVKKIKQQIKQEKDIALKKEKEEQKQEQLNANQVDIENMVEINILLEKIAKIETSLKDNILLKRYSNYLSYGKIVNELDSLKNSLKSKSGLSEEQEYQLHNKIRVKENELELIAEYKGSPIGGLINPPEIEKYENITNPFGIINALSNIKKLENNKKQFKSLEAEIQALASTLEDELVTYLELFNLDPKLEYKDKITFLDKQKKILR
ncbi:conserved hypothetical protein [Aliarcobacter butzleri JV22]|uniref:hypothetical protein n=1 Tax=Aliarcobacter butzleri TaxID=28197 RepID=UPI0001F1261D|nr:hypothetical protein [Aliarcobacter butzleri]EFU69333.1 conserved hypothetical protein [Aliarcobacter butzleri JV22]